MILASQRALDCGGRGFGDAVGAVEVDDSVAVEVDGDDLTATAVIVGVEQRNAVRIGLRGELAEIVVGAEAGGS